MIATNIITLANDFVFIILFGVANLIALAVYDVVQIFKILRAAYKVNFIKVFDMVRVAFFGFIIYAVYDMLTAAWTGGLKELLLSLYYSINVAFFN